MNNSISIDPQGLKNLSAKIENDANQYLAKIKAVYSIVESVKSSWAGKDCNEYINKVNSYRTNIEELGNVLKSYASFLAEVAKNYNNAQNAIYDAFK